MRQPNQHLVLVPLVLDQAEELLMQLQNEYMCYLWFAYADLQGRFQKQHLVGGRVRDGGIA
jgi:hypothetical protein